MNYTKEPWEEIRKQLSHLQDDWFELDKAYIHFSNLKALLNDTFIERSKKEHIACAGITDEALEKGLIRCAVENLAANLPFEDGNFYFDDVKVWEDV